MGVPLERRSHGSFYRRKGSEIIFDGNDVEAEKRKQNRDRIASQQETPMPSLGRVKNDIGQQEVGITEIVDNPQKIKIPRRTRGKGRHIKNPK